jgi:hypothetical protein
MIIKLYYIIAIHDKSDPVTTAWRVLGVRMEERPPIRKLEANMLNKQPRTADKEWFSSLGVGRGANNSSPLKRILLRNIHRQSLGPGLLFCCDPSNEKGTRGLVLGMLGACIGQVHLRQQLQNVRSLYRAGSLTATATEC